MFATRRTPSAVAVVFLLAVFVLASSTQESCAGEESCRLPTGTAMMQVSSLDLRGQQFEMDALMRGGGHARKSAITGRSHSRSAHLMRVRSFAAYAAYFTRKFSAAQASKQPAITELNALVGKFIDQQSNSEDKCSSQLLEAKHQLNQLHEVIEDLGEETNSTQVSDEVLDKQLQDKKDEMDKVEEWKIEKLRECKEQVEERKTILVTLKQELMEMQHIARPNVTMDSQGGTVSSGVALLEEAASDPFSVVEGMVTKTKTAAASLQQCVDTQAYWKSPVTQDTVKNTITLKIAVDGHAQPGNTSNNNNIVGNSNNTASTPEECLEQKENLEKLYVKTYVHVTRLITESEELIKSTSCEDSVKEELNVKKKPIDKDIDALVKKIEALEEKLEETRPRLEDAYTAEKKMREQIKDLTEDCAQLPETITDLDKVRDAITAMGKCPGLNATEFTIPMWTGGWISVTQKSDESDATFDDRMNAACAAKFGDGSPHSARSAEVSEITASAIEGMPLTNTAGKSIVGACPLCAGKSDEETGLLHADGHARVCWEPDVTLSSAGMSKGCSNGIRAVLCILDRGNIRDQAREDLQSDSESFVPSAAPGTDNNNDNDGNHASETVEKTSVTTITKDQQNSGNNNNDDNVSDNDNNSNKNNNNNDNNNNNNNNKQ